MDDALHLLSAYSKEAVALVKQIGLALAKEGNTLAAWQWTPDWLSIPGPQIQLVVSDVDFDVAGKSEETRKERFIANDRTLDLYSKSINELERYAGLEETTADILFEGIGEPRVIPLGYRLIDHGERITKALALRGIDVPDDETPDQARKLIRIVDLAIRRGEELCE